MYHRCITPEGVGGDHAGNIDWIFSSAELRCIAQFSFLQVKNGRPFLYSHRNHIYAFLNSFFADSLRAQDSPVSC